MTVSRINEWFERLGAFQIAHRFKFLVVILVISVVGLAGLPKLHLEDDTETWLTRSEKQKEHIKLFDELFGNQDVVAVLVEADDVFDPRVLDAIERLSTRLENEVPFANEVTSLTRLSVSIGNDEGMQIVNPFDEGIPGRGQALDTLNAEDKSRLEEIRSFILGRKSLVNNLVSDDSKETWVILSLQSFEDERNDMYAVGNAAIPIVESDEFKSDFFTFKGSGMSYTETEEQAVVGKETATRILSGLVVMIICLIVFSRSVRTVIVPLISTIGGIGTVLGFSAHLNIQGQSTIVTLPILLGMALSVGYAVHFINSFQYELSVCHDRKRASVLAVKATGWPILFTVVTTIVSFVSFMGIGIGALKWVGAISSAIVLAVYLYTMILLPIFLSFGKVKEKDKAVALTSTKKHHLEKSQEQYRKFGEGVIKMRKQIIAISLVLAVVSIFGITKIKVNMDYVNMMGKKIPYVARIMSIMNAKLGNQYSYDVLIEFDEEDAFKNPEIVKALDSCAEDLSKLRLTKISGDTPRITSVTNIIKEMNRTLNADDLDYYVVPDDEEYLSQLMFLYEISGGTNLSSWVSDDYRISHIHVDLQEYDAANIDKDIADAREIAKKHFPNAEVSLIGAVIDFAAMNNVFVTGEIKSLLGSFIIILVILIIAFSSLRAGLIAMIPNVAPVLLVGGVMGYAGLSLDMLTMTIMPMILGIAVDDTIHFTNHVKYEYEILKDYREAVIMSFVKVGRSMFATTVILCAMFVMYMFSPIGMLLRVGLLSIVGLSAALVADYTLTPALLYIVKPLRKIEN